MKFENVVLVMLSLILVLSGILAMERWRSPETLDALQVCAKVHEDFWRDQCYSDIAKDLAKREEYRK